MHSGCGNYVGIYDEAIISALPVLAKRRNLKGEEELHRLAVAEAAPASRPSRLRARAAHAKARSRED